MHTFLQQLQANCTKVKFFLKNVALIEYKNSDSGRPANTKIKIWIKETETASDYLNLKLQIV